MEGNDILFKINTSSCIIYKAFQQCHHLDNDTNQFYFFTTFSDIQKIDTK